MSLRHIRGPLVFDSYTEKTSSGDVTVTSESVVLANKTSGAATGVTLPAAASPGGRRAVLVVDSKGDAASNNITVTVAGGGTINGGSSFVISENYGKMLFIDVGDEWQTALPSEVSAAELAVLNGVTAGTATASKALVVDSSTALTGLLGLTMSAQATPASVTSATATAQAAELTVTGGVGGNTTIASTGTGGIGGGFSFTAGAGGVASAATTAATGGAGGAWAVTTGAGGAEAVAGVTSTGGRGGAWTVTTGAGGAVSAAVSGTATGGASGALTFATGTGGAVTATTGTNVGGASGNVSFLSGVGGAASGATDTGGASGSFTIGTGTGGAGDTGGASGDLVLVTGAAGSGGSPAVGVISFKPGTATERFRMTSTGAMASGAATPTNTNLLGVYTGVGFAVTDATASIISASTHGSGSTATLIGNATITVSSDSRIKKDVVTWSGNALSAISRAPRLVEFTYDIPGCGGDLAAEGDEDARKYGPNARGRYLGFIAQETIDWAPWVVNAGAGKDCHKCRKGQKCEEHTTPWTVEYEHLVPLLIKAVQELTAKIAVLEAKLMP